MSTVVLKLAVVTIALSAGAGLKVARYGAPAESPSEAALAHATQIMNAHGWREVTKPNAAASTLHEQRAYTRGGCQNPVIVAALAGNAEGAQFFRIQNGGNVAFIQDDVVAHPSGYERQVQGVIRQFKRLAGFAVRPAMPVIAIAPAPLAQPGACDGPPRSAWQSKHPEAS